MNCAECRNNLVAYAEGLLERETLFQCRAHLEGCAACRTEYEEVLSLQRRLAARGQAAAEVSIVKSVVQRVLQEKEEKERIMSKLFKYRWGFGISAAAGAAAIILITFLALPKTQATAAEVMARGAQAVANLTSIYLRGEVRTTPQDNFSAIMPDQNFSKIELWEQFEPDFKWRIEKPLRIAVMDGRSTTLLIKNADIAVKIPQANTSAFDSEWLQRIADLSNIITNELNNALAKGWKMSLTNKTGADGQAEDVVTIEAKSGLPAGDYLQNKFFQTANTRRVYVFDDRSGRLESAEIYLHGATGDKLIFRLDQIDYNPPIDPDLWTLKLPADVSWYQPKMQKLPDNEKYASMTAQQAARAFFEACSQENWSEAEKFLRESPVDHLLKEKLGGLKIISVGTAFTSKAGPDQFVPYEIRLKNGDVRKMNLALRRDKPTGRWFVDGGW